MLGGNYLAFSVFGGKLKIFPQKHPEIMGGEKENKIFLFPPYPTK
jgi:hypothetical protein